MKDTLKKELQAPQVKVLTARAQAIYEDFVVASTGKVVPHSTMDE
jgi:hypothetical protein